MKSNILFLLGLAQKAGKLVSGQDSVERALMANKIYLVIVSEDASDNTRKRFLDSANFRNIPIIFFGMSGELGKCIGKSERKVLGITDKGLAIELLKRLKMLTGVGDIGKNSNL